MRSRSPAEITSYPIPEKLLSPTLAVSLSQRINHNTDFLNPNKHGNESNGIKSFMPIPLLACNLQRCRCKVWKIMFHSFEFRSNWLCTTLAHVFVSDISVYWASAPLEYSQFLKLYQTNNKHQSQSPHSVKIKALG